MKQMLFDYSLKNIPLHSRMLYNKILIGKTSDFLRRLRWKVFYFQNKNSKISKETYGFNSQTSPPFIPELKGFEEDVYNLAKHIEFRHVNDEFQAMLAQDVKKILNCEDIIVSADKSNNKYRLPKEEYQHLLEGCITSEYKKADKQEINATNHEAAKIAKKLDLDDRIDEYIQADAFLTVKDHKPNFPSKVQCRLLNPAKSNIGKISKIILADITKIVRNAFSLNQWTKTTDVIKWFEHIQNKKLLTFFKFDVVTFYPSISEQLFSTTIDWARTITPIESNERNILYHARKSFLFSNNSTWVKKAGNNFDVPMGAFDGAEVCELVGLYLLKQMEVFIPREQVGLYRDDGLAAVKASGPETDRLRKDITKMFKDLGLRY